jgi:cysteine-rich repeat protein
MWCGEACDDGAENGSCGKCASDCQKHVGLCGDGNVDTGCGEVCDDGNTTSGDGCRGDCMGIEQCGDNLVDKNETCDDGNTSSCGGSCKSDCSGFYNDVCHDGVRESCETCEDTNTANTGIDDGCSAQLPNCNACKVCSVSVCGNGKVEAGEVCEPTGTCSDESGGSCTLQDTSQCPANVGCTFLLVSGNCSDDCQGVIP